MNTMNKCIVCGKQYDPKETIRSCGDMHWTYNRCRARCYTKYVMTLNFFIKEIEETLSYSDADITKQEVERLAKISTLKIIDKSAKNLRKGKVSKPVNLSKYK